MNDPMKLTRRSFLFGGGSLALMLFASSEAYAGAESPMTFDYEMIAGAKNNPASQTDKLREMAHGRELPFSFVYNGKHSSSFLKDWQLTEEMPPTGRGWNERHFVYCDPVTNLQVVFECRLYKDFPATEWVLHFQNGGSEDTPIIENIQALDISLERRLQGDFIFHHSLGSNASKNDFAPLSDPLRMSVPIHLAPVGGRSSSTTALPFFNIEAVGEGGIILGIGWTGQWAANIMQSDEKTVSVQAGMELTHLKLHPQERIRSPRISLLNWKGNDYMEGHNLFRRFAIQHHSPHINGKTPLCPFACGASGPPDEANTATVENQLAYAAKFKQYGVEYYWIDAGWYEGGWPNGVGNWVPRQNGFPDGMKPLTNALKKLGMKGLILWFEPERVFQGTDIDKEHYDWVIHLPGNPNGLFNLGNDEARKWLTDHISDMIRTQGISVYRQDFNIDPLPFWRANDTPDRQGITEIRHVEGLYAYWDELLKRNPGLIIDNCASGGRRIDLETIDRCVFLWRSDYQYYEPEGMQSQTYGISYYIPTTSTGCGYPDPYSFLSSINSGVAIWVPWTGVAPYDVYDKYLPWVHWDPKAPFPYKEASELVKEFKKVRNLFYGDYYPLTPYSTESDVWIAYQYHDEAHNKGMALAFRRANCPVNALTIHLKKIKSGKRYVVRATDDVQNRILSGADMMKGITITTERAPVAILMTYETLD